MRNHRAIPTVSVIVLNFNGADCLRDCLASLEGQSYRGLEIIVADNGSTDKSKEVAADFPVQWVELKRNFGFAHANNLAANHASGSLLTFVNNDMRFDRCFIERLVSPLISSNEVFATDARQLDWAGDKAIHLATRLASRPLAALFRAESVPLPRLSIEQVDSKETCDVIHACAANMAVRRSMFEHLGGFDPFLPAGWEDADICWRAWLRGWRTLFVPGAVCWHHVGRASSSQVGSWLRYRGALGGRLRFASKHLPLEDALLLWALALAGSPREAFRRGLTGLKQRFSVLIETIRHLPSALIERRRMYQMARISPRRHIQHLREIGAANLPD